MRGGKEGRGPGRPSPVKPLNWGQDPIPAAGAAQTTPQLLPEAVARLSGYNGGHTGLASIARPGGM